MDGSIMSVIKRINNDGFTLLETLIAMAVVAVAMAALWKGLGQGQMVSQALPERLMARWVAQNHVIIKQVMAEWPEPGNNSGNDTMGGRLWYWEEQISNTDDQNMKRITVRVGHTPELMQVTLEGYLHRQSAPIPYEQVFFR
jgi:general secretion pathway protein I